MPLIKTRDPGIVADLFANLDAAVQRSAKASPFQLPPPLQNFLVSVLDFLTPSTEEEVVNEMAIGIMPDPANFSMGLKGLNKLPLPQIEQFIRRGARQSEGLLEGSQDAIGLLETRLRGVRGEGAGDAFRNKLDEIGTPSNFALDDISIKTQLDAIKSKSDDLIFPAFGAIRPDTQANFLHSSVEAKRALFDPTAIRPGGGTVSLGPDVLSPSTAPPGSVSLEAALRHELTHGVSGSVPPDIKRKVLSEISFDNPLPRARPTSGLDKEDLVEMFSEFGEGAIPASRLPAGLEFFEDIINMLFDIIPNRPGVPIKRPVLPEDIIQFTNDSLKRR